MTESEPEELVNGASHVDKIGRVVVVDIEGPATVGVRGGLSGNRQHRTIISGKLHGTEDRFDGADDLASTALTIGDALVVIDWNDPPKVGISIVTNGGRNG